MEPPQTNCMFTTFCFGIWMDGDPTQENFVQERRPNSGFPICLLTYLWLIYGFIGLFMAY